jgi:hypothetical protein
MVIHRILFYKKRLVVGEDLEFGIVRELFQEVEDSSCSDSLHLWAFFKA